MAVVTRVSTFNVFQNTQGNIRDVQGSLFDLQRQISSGFQTETFEGLAPNTEQFTNLEAKIRKLTTYENNNSQAIARLESTGQAMDQFIELADDIEDLMVLRRDGVLEDNINFDLQLRNIRETLASQLNVSFEGRFLFGGTRTNIPPVITQPVPEAVTPGELDNNYYQGSSEDITLRASDEFELQYNVRADDIGFQKVFTAMSLALEGHEEDSDDKMISAINQMQDGIQGVISKRSEVNINFVNVTQITTRHEDLRLYWQGVSEELINTDLLSASTQVTQDEAQLQATFQVFARINNLRLSDFL